MSYILLSLDIGNVSFILKEGSILKGSVVDRHRFDADPDPPNVHVDADQIRNGLSILIRILPQILHILDIWIFFFSISHSIDSLQSFSLVSNVL